MLEREVPHLPGRFRACRCGKEPRHISSTGRSAREPVISLVEARSQRDSTRHRLECRCDAKTSRHDSLAAAEAEWGSDYAQMPFSDSHPTFTPERPVMPNNTAATPGTPTSIMVYGPQGCGKTRNAHRIAQAFGCTIIEDEPASLAHAKDMASRGVAVLILTNDESLYRTPSRWFAQIKYDDAMAQIAKSERTSRPRRKRAGGVA